MARKVPVLEATFGGNRTTRLGRIGNLSNHGISQRGENRIMRVAREEIRRVMVRVVDDVKKDYFRTGNAYNVMRYEGIRVNGTTLGTLRATLLGPTYIAQLEGGGTIEPTRSQKLAIPILFGLKPDNTPKLPSPRSWANIVKTFVYKSKITGRSYIAYSEKTQPRWGNPEKMGELRILYVLVDEVEIEGRGKILAAFNRYKGLIEDAIYQAFMDEIDRKENHVLPKARITTGGKRRR